MKRFLGGLLLGLVLVGFVFGQGTNYTRLLWAAIQGKPSTLAGYGITDAASSARVTTLESNDYKPAYQINKPRIVCFACGGFDEAILADTGTTVSYDTTNFKQGSQAIKITTSGSGNYFAYLNAGQTGFVAANSAGQATAGQVLGGTNGSPISFGGVALVGMWAYIPEPAKITALQVRITAQTSALAWNRSYTDFTSTLATGWNLFLWPAWAGSIDDNWGTTSAIRIFVGSNAVTNISVQVFGVLWNKAQLIIVNDGGKRNFFDDPTYGYIQLKAARIPVTIATIPGAFGTQTGTDGEIISSARLQQLASENGNSVSLHSYNFEVSGSSTANDFSKYAAQSLKQLSLLTSEPILLRAAVTQNTATTQQVAALKTFFPFIATGSSSATLNTWPLVDRSNIARLAIHSQTSTTWTNFFDNLRRTHSLMVVYSHAFQRIGTSSTDMTNAQWTDFFTRVQTGISAGWLEPVTLNELFTRTGGTITTSDSGELVARWKAIDGTEISQRVY